MNWLKKNWAKIIYICLLIILALSFVFRISVIDGDSMYPTLQNGEYVITRHVFTDWGKEQTIEQYDIVVAKAPDEPSSYEPSLFNFNDKLVIKRVMAVPGDTVEIKDGLLYVNGVADDAGGYQHGEIYQENVAYTLGENEYWLEGDNRSVSKDSTVYGPASGELIVAEYIAPTPGLTNLFSKISVETMRVIAVLILAIIIIFSIADSKSKVKRKFFVVSENWELKRCLKIRKKVFVEEQNVSPKDLISEYDIIDNEKVFHVILYVKDKYIGTCRCQVEEDVIKITQVAILKKYRKQKHGSAMIKFAEQYAKEHYEFNEFHLETQAQLLPFYKNLGYHEYGDIVMCAGIEHIRLKKENINE